MKVVLISSAGGRIPAGLRDIVARGSTSLVEHLADEFSTSPLPDADRVVFWSTTGEDVVQRLIGRFAREAGSDDPGRLLVVQPDGGGEWRPDVAADQLYIWPRDEDRLKVVFLTGA